MTRFGTGAAARRARGVWFPFALAATCLGVGGSSGSITQQSAGMPEALLRMVNAHGGLDRFRAIADWSIVAERNIQSAADVETYEEYMKREDSKIHTLLVKSINRMESVTSNARPAKTTLVYGHDGVRGFSMADGILLDEPGAEAEGYYRAHGEYYLRALPFKWLDPGMSARALGKDADGYQLVEIRAEPGVGRASRDVWIAAIDPETHLLYEARLTHQRSQESLMDEARSGVSEITYRYGDYREASGLEIAHRMEYYSRGRKTGDNVIQEIRINEGISSSLFTPAAHR